MDGYTIYIIDADKETNVQLGDYLSLAGFRVESADNGHSGMELILKAVPDLVLMDVQLPGMDGLKILERMRKEASTKQVPVIFISGSSRTSLKVKALERGADDFIVKPLERTELFARIKVALRRGTKCPCGEGTMKGSLDDISLPELLQTLNVGKKTARVRFPEMLGEVFTAAGMLVQARQGGFRGEAALIRLLFLEKGSFSVEFGALAERPNAEVISIQHQLLNCLVKLDTVRDIFSELPEDNPIIEDTIALPDFVDSEQLAKYLPMPLHDLFVMMPGDLVTNAELFVQQYKRENIFD